MKKDKKHSHIHTNISSLNKEHNNNIKTAFLINLLFGILEFVGGFLTNSISIFSDAIHDIGDSISIGIAYLLENKSKKNPDNTYSYGYLRYSLIGALITSIILIFGSIFVLFKAIPRLIDPQEINHDAMIIFAIFGVMINGYAAYKTRKGKKNNEKTINLHMLEDVFGWAAVLIGSIVIKITGLLIIDPILSICIALFILFHVYRNLKDVFDIFMEKVPKDINIESLKKNIIKDFKNINNIHHIHVWSIDEINVCMTAHIVLDKIITNDEIITLKNDIKKYLKENGISHVTLEIEYPNENCESHEC